MEVIIPDTIINLLGVSAVLSSIIMVTIQKIKHFSFITKSYQITFINIFLSFAIGIPFSMYFYNYTLIEGIWIGFFSIVGASSIYEILKNQNIINYTPKALDDYVEEIRRD